MLPRLVFFVAILLAALAGCDSKPPLAQLSGKVTFKGQPVPAGFISFTPDVANGGKGPVRVLQIKDGVYDSALNDPEPGLPPGPYFLRISGFDGVVIPRFGQGKQIFNEVRDIEFVVPDGTTTKDFVIPEAAGHNVRIEFTSDI